MKVQLLKTTKYKKKMLSPGMHDVIQKCAKEWIKIGIAREIAENKKSQQPKKDKTPVEVIQEGELAELQAAAKELEIDTEGKSADELKEEIELAKELELGEDE